MRRRRFSRYFENDITAGVEDDLGLNDEPGRLVRRRQNGRRLPLYEKDGFVVYKEILPATDGIERYYKYTLTDRERHCISTVDLTYGMDTEWFWDVKSEDMRFNRHDKYFSYLRAEQAILDYMKEKIEKESSVDGNRE